MKIFLFLFISLHAAANASSLQPKDTIDNWQIYLDDSLIFAGNQNYLNVRTVTLTKTKLKQNSKIRIVYNRDTSTKNKVEIQMGNAERIRYTQRYFTYRERIIIKTRDLINLKEEITLYFFNATLTMPGKYTRGQALITLKFL